MRIIAFRALLPYVGPERALLGARAEPAVTPVQFQTMTEIHIHGREEHPEIPDSAQIYSQHHTS